jgi:hypothetical protein
MVFDGHFSRPIQSYRAYCYPWTGNPATKPTVTVRASAPGQRSAYASWNGATQVASWQFLGGRSPGSLKPLAFAPWGGFETSIRLPGGQPYVAVRALDAGRRVLATSAPVKA